MRAKTKPEAAFILIFNTRASLLPKRIYGKSATNVTGITEICRKVGTCEMHYHPAQYGMQR